ncbi:hypothetical protein ACKUB1_15750 [Methanospirillum stamsii]|nr:hypothetical protein [Methanospirillum stamsii]
MNRTEVIMDGVRRLVKAYQTEDLLKLAVFRSLHGKKGTTSFSDIAYEYDPIDVESAITEAFHTDSIDEIIDEVRR